MSPLVTLVYPVQDDGSRKREYVGADPEKIKVELDKLERGQEYLKMQKELKSIENKLWRIDNSMREAHYVFKW
jgi:hypothetical protein